MIPTFPFRPAALALLASCTVPVTALAATVSAVNWGGQYVDADTELADHDPAKLGGGGDKYGDPDGVFDINGSDSLAGRALSLDSSFSPPSGYSGTSGTFFGAGSVTREGSLVNDGYSELSVLNQGPNDSVHWHVDTGGDLHTFHLLMFWDKADFLNGLDTTGPLTLIDGSFTLTTAQVTDHTDEVLRWVVRDGSQFYVSEGTELLQNNTSYLRDYSDLTNWAVYNPVDPVGDATLADLQSIDFDETSTFSPHTFTDVTAVGFYVEREAATGPAHVHVEAFGATLVPEPSTATLLFSGLVLFLGRRRIRA